MDQKISMNIAIIGAGTMGQGIAQVSAQAGHHVVLYDIKSEALELAKAGIEKNLNKGVSLGKISEQDKMLCMGNIQYTTDFQVLQADMVIEAIIEKPEPKVELFRKLSEINRPNCIFATNTSSIPITRISRDVPNPERVIGIHFFNPAHIMKLVEVVKGAHSSDEATNQAVAYIKGIGKTPILAMDAPGFIVNRVGRHWYVESLKCLEEGLAPIDVMDELMESVGFKMGPFRLMDLIGVDTNFSVTQSMFELFHQDAKFRPSRIQEQKVLAGFHGRKSGRGFYSYDA